MTEHHELAVQFILLRITERVQLRGAEVESVAELLKGERLEGRVLMHELHENVLLLLMLRLQLLQRRKNAGWNLRRLHLLLLREGRGGEGSRGAVGSSGTASAVDGRRCTLLLLLLLRSASSPRLRSGIETGCLGTLLTLGGGRALLLLLRV